MAESTSRVLLSSESVCFLSLSSRVAVGFDVRRESCMLYIFLFLILLAVATAYKERCVLISRLSDCN